MSEPTMVPVVHRLMPDNTVRCVVVHEAVWCPVCKKWWIKSGMSCTMSHFDWECCHAYDTEVKDELR